MSRDQQRLWAPWRVPYITRAPSLPKGCIFFRAKRSRDDRKLHVVARGRLAADGVFSAEEVLAKHDENYMPPEAAHALDKAKQAEKIQQHTQDAAKTLSK